MAFKGDVKFGQSALHTQEEWLKKRLLPLVPRRVETYHLTLTTVAWSLLIILFSFFARFHPAWLWGVSLMIVMQYLTDLLDGAVGRLRNTGLVKWGYYMDHFLDFVFLCAILIGYAILLPQAYRTDLFFIMALFAGFMVNSFLAFACTNRFQIAYLGVGPTEIRLVFIAVNTLIILFGKTHMVNALPYILALSAFGLFVTVYRTANALWRIDMHNKNNPPQDAP
jgi:phosphatidylglycerophosphate synthase